MDNIDVTILKNVAKWTPKNQELFGNAIEYIDRYVDGDFFDIYNLSILKVVDELNALYEDIEDEMELKSVVTFR